ncbi:proline dehydrogenase family protein [Candidatus Uabimicrobium amorphum]|uniref:proline dehydrogenase n=1 Tax=Uabimicrobium amorphum TaxID=2596890 RepID=A0A5S9F3N7_UABAM|nr:proline dehydrogenase family protein [Candidatus Uabimicrobium amorphum]BBM84876.1 proline dehydrogenase 1 [Candidatus Uabimicrobium amorphum]
MRLFNSLVAHTLPYVPKSIVGLVSKRYLAGETIASAMATAKALNEEGAVCTIDLLGEFVTSESEVQKTIALYKDIITKIHEEKVTSSISLKPTSFGALIDREQCAKNIYDLVVFAKEKDVQVTIDMEDHPYTDFTLETYDKLRKEFPQHIRTVVQAYLKRTLPDVKKLAESERCCLRLCKGIYDEPADISYKDRNKVNENYLAILRVMMEKKSYVGIATHDDYLVYKAFEMIEEFSLTEKDYEFQMLLGVRSELRKEILGKGHPLRIYIPFGEKWYEYSLRRLKENPNIAGNIIKGVLTFGR